MLCAVLYLFTLDYQLWRFSYSSIYSVMNETLSLLRNLRASLSPPLLRWCDLMALLLTAWAPPLYYVVSWWALSSYWCVGTCVNFPPAGRHALSRGPSLCVCVCVCVVERDRERERERERVIVKAITAWAVCGPCSLRLCEEKEVPAHLDCQRLKLWIRLWWEWTFTLLPFLMIPLHLLQACIFCSWRPARFQSDFDFDFDFDFYL